MITAQNLIDSAGRLINLNASGESMTANESADALQTLNDLLDALSIEELSAFAVNSAIYTLTPGQQMYTIGIDPTGGSTANFSAPAPNEIKNANLVFTTSGTTSRRPLDMLNDDEWSEIRVQSVASPIPTKLYYSPGFPFSQLYLWPIPSATNQLEIYTLAPLSNIATLATNILFPQGYQRMLRYILAVELSAEFGIQAPPAVIQIALEAKMQVQSRNSDAPLMRCDPAILGTNGAFYWPTGGY